MAVRRLSLVLDLDSGQFSTRIKDATGQVKVLSSQAAVAGEKIEAMERQTHRSIGTLDSFNRQVWKMQLTLYSVTFLFGGFTAGLVKMNAEAQRSIALLTGLSKKQDQLGRRADAAADFKYLRQFAKEAPYDLGVLTDTFVKLKAAGIDPTAGAMKALVEGIASFGGNSDAMRRATVAIAQMAGKGTVSMEELRQQLGEAMPTALRIMAKAAGKSIPEFVAEVSKGRVMWKSVQDKFFAELLKESEGASERLKNTLGGQTEIMKTNLRELALAVGGFQADGSFARGGFMSELTEGAKGLNEWLANPETIKGAQELGGALADLIIGVKDFFGFINDNAELIKFGAGLFLVSKAASMTKAGLTALAASQLGLQTVTRATVKEALSERAAKVANIAQTYKMQKAAAEEAAAIVAANKAKQASITGNVLALQAEAAQIEKNIALNRAQRAAALADAAAARRNAAAGFGSVIVGAGSQSRTAQARAVEANNSLKLNQQQLARTSAELAAQQAALAATTTALTASQTAASVAIARTSMTARAGAAAMGLLRGVMGFLGGPIVGSLLIAGTAAAFLFSKFKEGEQAIKDYEAGSADLNEKLKEQAKWLSTVGVESKAVGTEAATATPKVENFAGQVGDAAQKLYDLATAAKKARIETAQLLVTEAQANMQRAERAANHRAFKDKVVAWMSFNPEMPGDTRGADMWDAANERKAKTLAPAQVALQQAKAQLKAAKELADEAYAKDSGVQAGFASWQEEQKALKAGAGGKKPKVTAADRLDAQIERLGASQPAINALIDTMDEGSKAAEEMRAKIAGMREMGKTISPQQEAQAIAAARENARLEKAYRTLNDVIEDYRTNQLSAKEAVASLGDSTNPTTNAIEKFNRKLDGQVETFMRLNPEIAKSPERLAEFNRVVEQSKADFKLTQVANAARALADEMDRLQDSSIDPDLQVWDAWRSKIREIDEQLKNASDPETISSLNASRAKFTDDYLGRIEQNAKDEAEAIEDGLLTADQARQRAYEREIERIEKLTDISHLNEEERARWAARMAAAREQMTAAATAQYERDTETSAERLAREWGDVTANMKELSGRWMEDFHDQLISGEFNFKSFLGSILTDYLDTLLKAQMARFMQPAMDGLVNMGMSFLGGMFGMPSGTGTPTFGSGATTPGGSMSLAGLFHTGGIVGSASMMKGVSPGVFAGAKRYHRGGFPGLNYNEVPIIAEKGEGVFTKDQMKALGAGGQQPSVQVNVINESGVGLDAQQGGMKFDGQSYVVDVLVDAISKPGRARNAIMGLK